jgi:Pregnancy-associated plasma protein-A/Secretion system C-terminal sorting domain
MRKLYTILTVLLFGTGSLMAQRNCGTMEYLQTQIQKDPSLVRNLEKQESQVQSWIRDNGANLRMSGTVITVPVVVHVVYRTAVQNISLAQVQSQIDVLNEDYGGTNADISSVPAPWAGLAGATGIQFCLASRDPQGNPTTGINRVQTTVTSFTQNDNVKFTSSGGANAWDRNSYLNFWVCNLGGGLLGYSQFPGTGAANTDGIVIGYSYFGRTGTVSSPYNKGRTATHEVGHWFNLRHIWGDDGGACTGSDQVADTPNQAGENYGCPNYPLTDACSAASPGVMFMNYMDYTDDACMYFFTAGQSTRMNAVLSGSRASIATSQGCVPVILPTDDASVDAISSPSGTYCTDQITPSFTLKNYGANSLTTVTINWQIDAGAVQTQAWTGTLASLASTTVTLPTQSVAGGNHTITIYTSSPNGNSDGQPSNDSKTNSFTIATTGQAVPFSYNFAVATWPPLGWTLNNPDNAFTWEHSATVGNGGNGAVFVNNFDYTDRGQRDEFVLPSMNLAGAAAATLTFDLSYVLYSQTGYSDTLIIYGSTDCGVTWTQLYKKFDQALTTVTPYFLQGAFTPSSANQWRNESVSINSMVGSSGAIIKFVNATDYENNLYIDNINITTGTVAIDDASLAAAVTAFPNPTTGAFKVNVNLPTSSDLSMSVYNSLGQKVAAHSFASITNGSMEFDLTGQAQGVYFLRVEADGKMIVKKIVLQ